MRCRYWMLLGTFLAAGVLGCGGSDGSGSGPGGAEGGTQVAGDRQSAGGGRTAAGSDGAPADDTSRPETAVSVFLAALRRGDDAKILDMYTQRARQQAAQLSEHFSPQGSDTARFEVGEVEYLAEDGARVACTFTDLDQDGNPHALELLWMVRREREGWRVAGMAVYPYPGEAPVLIDFENIEAAKRTREQLDEEDRRRQEAEALQAREPENSANSARR